MFLFMFNTYNKCCWIDVDFWASSEDWQVLCTKLPYLSHPCGAILDPLGILASLLLIPPSLAFIRWLSAMRSHRCYEI